MIVKSRLNGAIDFFFVAVVASLCGRRLTTVDVVKFQEETQSRCSICVKSARHSGRYSDIVLTVNVTTDTIQSIA